MRHDVADNPTATQILDAVHRSFTKPRKMAFTQSLLNSVEEIEVHSKEGLYLGRAASYDVDLSRLCRVIERTTLGLYFHEFGNRLPNNFCCVVYAIDGFTRGEKTVEESLRRLVDAAVSGKIRVFGNKVFTYWVQRIEDSEGTTLWAHLVYSKVAFLALTLPRQSVELGISQNS